MKRIILILAFFCLSIVCSFGEVVHITLKKGETYTINNYWGGGSNTGSYDLGYITGNSVAVEHKSTGEVNVYAITAGISTLQNFWYSSGNLKVYVFNVVDVTDINIEYNVELVVGESFTYVPIITDKEATTTLSWTSGNTAVATVTSQGVVTATGVGKSIITCTATNGVSAQSLVTVSPKLAESLTLSEQSQELSVGETVQLHTTILPSNVTSSNVKWLSSNENIAQVDDSGNVTAIAPGYCSIFAIADDGSAKFDHCLITVPGTRSRGDVNNDGDVDVNDVTSIVKIIQSIKQ